MENYRIDFLPVVDDDGHLCGAIALRDIAARGAPRLAGHVARTHAALAQARSSAPVV
jgi:hypothetical protein